MRLLASQDPDIEGFADQFLGLKTVYDRAEFPYWILVDDQVAYGLIVVAREPRELIQPAGTTFVQIHLFRHDTNAVSRILTESNRIAENHEAAFIGCSIEAKETTTARLLEETGLPLFDESFGMVCSLTGVSSPETDLSFELVTSEHAELVSQYLVPVMEGSPDQLMQASIGNMARLSPADLGPLLEEVEFYLVRRDQDIIGLLSLRGHIISLVGVMPSERGKGYGSIIVQQALWQLAQVGHMNARLRISVENKPAIHIYESLGFRVINQIKYHLMKRPGFWRE